MPLTAAWSPEGPGIPPGGEIWNLPFEGGIVEDFLSSRAIQANYQKRTGNLRDVAEIAAAAAYDPGAANDFQAAAVFSDFGRHLGLALRMTLFDFAPQAAVLGGGISRSAHLFMPVAESYVEGLNLRLVPSSLKDDAPLVGAAVAWFSAPSGRD